MVNVTIITAGTSGPRGNGWLSGAGAPSNSIGFDGDFYLDTTNTSVFYGPKANGVWPTATTFSAQKQTTSTVNPGPTNDNTQSYAIGSIWINSTTGAYFVAESVATAAAVWYQVFQLGTIAGTAAAGNDPRIVGALQATNNLSDLTSPSGARGNLGLGGAAVLNVGTTVGTVAAGNDSRIVNAIESGSSAGGDLSGTLPNPSVVSTHLAAPLPINQGGTASTTQNFVDLTTTQNIGGLKTFTGEVVVPTPVGQFDAATKGYADGIAAGISVKNNVAAATVSGLPSNNYSNGTSGIGATLTATASGILIVDGYTPVLNDRIIVKNEADATHNGIYNLTTVGTSAVPYVLTRSTDMNTPVQVAGATAFVDNGTTNKNSSWTVVAYLVSYIIGFNNINWTQFSSPGTITAGTGISVVGNQVSLITPVAQVNLPSATTSQSGIVELDGTAGDIQPLGVQAAGSVGKAADAGHVHPTTGVVLTGNAATTVVSETSYGQAPAVGVDTTYAREDHTHGSPSLSSATPASEAIGTAGSAGVATTPARADHVHPMAAAGTPTNSAVTDTASTGSATTFAASNHVHGREGFGTPTAQTTYGLTSTTGSASTVSHSDHTHGTPSLTTTPPSTTLAIGTAASLGTATTPALADHVHPMATAGLPTTSAVTDSPNAGNATTFAASNHVHGREGFGAVVGLSAFGTPAANGTATTVSHSDHVHGVPALPAATTGSQGIVQLAGDLGGSAASPSVLKINGVAVGGTPSAATSPILVATSSSTAQWTSTSQVGLASSTGTISGCQMSKLGNITFALSAGKGFLADYATTPSTPSVTPVSIAQQIVTLGAAEQARFLSWWVADINGVVTSLSAAPTPDQRRQSIQLGSTTFTAGALNSVTSNPVFVPQESNQRYDLGASLGNFRTSGAKIAPNGANLLLNLPAGTIFSIGTNYGVDILNPDIVTTIAENPCNFFYATNVTNSETSAGAVDPTHYNVNGVVTLVPGGGATSTIQRVFLLTTRTVGSQVVIQYGQSFYSSLANAVAAVGVDTSFTLNPDLNQAALIAWICITKSCTSLSDTNNCSIISASKFANP